MNDVSGLISRDFPRDNMLTPGQEHYELCIRIQLTSGVFEDDREPRNW